MTMEENNAVQTQKKGRMLALWIAGGLVGLIVAVYLGLCVYVGASASVLPGVSVGGVSVGSMDRQQAAASIEDWARGYFDKASYTLRCGDTERVLDGSFVQVEPQELAEAAFAVGREENFFLRGAVILGQLFGGERALPCQAELSSAGRAKLGELLAQLAESENTPLVETVWSVNEGSYELVITRGITGRMLDEQQAELLVAAALQDLSISEHAVELPVLSEEPQALDVQAIYDAIHTEAKDAWVDPEEYAAMPHVVGIDFEVARVQEQFDKLAEGGTMKFPLTVTMPEVTQRVLQGRLFAHMLGECTSSVSGTANRRTNVKIATEAIHGVTLMPGEVFSYNDTLGPRTTANGYMPAPAYIGGKTVDDVGGGICQDSSTLYLAVLRANLEIVERTNHMYTVGYVPDGLDATVAYNAIDFRFRNNTEYPIRIDAVYEKNKLTIRLYGTKTDDYTVKMVTQTLSTNPYEVIYKADSSVAAGKTVVETTAYTGRKVQAYRCVYDGNGELVSKTLESTNNYRRRDKVILYNPADAAALGLVDRDGNVHETVLPVQPEPEPQPQPQPQPQPEPEPTPEPQPEPAPEPTPDPTPEPVPEPQPAPEPTQGERAQANAAQEQEGAA